MPDEDMQLLRGGDEVVALSRDDEFSVWHTRTGELLRTLAVPGDVDVFAAARDGSLLAAAREGGRVIAFGAGVQGSLRLMNRAVELIGQR